MEQFSLLPPHKRIESLLACIGRPTSKELLCKWSDIDLSRVDEMELRCIEDTLQTWLQPQSPSSNQSLYFIPPEQESEVLARIGVVSTEVDKQLSALASQMYGRNGTN